MRTAKMTAIKAQMQSGDVQGAAAELKKFLSAEPDNAEAQMLYGTCCHLLGDDKTFGEIHDALAPKMEKEKDEKKLSLWRKYHKLWMALIGTGLVFVGVACGAWHFGRDIVNMFGVAGRAATAYAGPEYYRIAAAQNSNDCATCSCKRKSDAAHGSDKAELPDLGPALWRCVESNDVAMLERVLASGGNPNTKDERNVSLLGRAAELYIGRAGDAKVIDTLLDHGADPNLRWGTGNGVTPFWTLVQGSHLRGASEEYQAECVSVVRKMLRKGADPNVKYGIRRVTALGIALVWNSHLELVKALVEGGAEISDKMVTDAKGEIKEYLTGVRNGTMKHGGAGNADR